jgi:hypothetical protein
MVMLVMAVLLLAGTSFLTISSTERQIALNERALAQAQLLAEAAIHKAIARLNEPNSTYSGETNTPLGGGTFTIGFEPPNGPVCPGNAAKGLIATASLPVTGGTAWAEIRATVDTVSYPYRWAAYAVVPNGTVQGNDYQGNNRTDKELWVLSTSLLDSFDSGGGTYDSTANSGAMGHIGANGDVSVEDNTNVKGNVWAGDGIFVEVGATVTGSQQENAASQSFPQVSPTKSASEALTVKTGDPPKILSAGTYYYKYLDFENGTSLTVSGPVTIYITGPAADALAVVRLGSNVKLGSEPGTQLRLITNSDTDTPVVRFLAGKDFRFYGSLYGTNTDVYIGDSSQIYGSLIGRTIKLGAGTNVHFDQAMSTQEVCHNGSNFSIRRGTWREIVPN